MAVPLSLFKKACYAPEPAVLKGVQDLTGTEKLFSISKVQGPLDFVPGQFVQVSVLGYGEAPFSVCSSPFETDGFDICVRDVGQVTHALHRLSPGDGIGLRGPYGNGFPLDKMKNRDLICIAGGIGLAPLRSLITYAHQNRKDFKRLIVIYGTKTPSALLFRQDLRKWESDPDMELHLIVDQPDDNWEGPTGVVTDPLKKLEIDPERTVAAVVGPPVVFRFVAMELLNKHMREEHIYFSLERRFQCGIGKCGHCQINDVYVCQDGPVFPYSSLLNRTEAVEAWAPEGE